MCSRLAEHRCAAFMHSGRTRTAGGRGGRPLDFLYTGCSSTFSAVVSSSRFGTPSTRPSTWHRAIWHCTTVNALCPSRTAWQCCVLPRTDFLTVSSQCSMCSDIHGVGAISGGRGQVRLFDLLAFAVRERGCCRCRPPPLRRQGLNPAPCAHAPCAHALPKSSRGVRGPGSRGRHLVSWAQVVLEDASANLPLLRRSPGMKTWAVQAPTCAAGQDSKAYYDSPVRPPHYTRCPFPLVPPRSSTSLPLPPPPPVPAPTTGGGPAEGTRPAAAVDLAAHS